MKFYLILIAFSVVVLVHCSEGRTYSVDGRQYFVSYPLKNNWYQALRYCFYNGMKLVDIPTAEENNRIQTIVDKPEHSHLKDTDGFWTSGTDQGAEGQGEYYWMTTGNGFHFTNWSNNHQPDKKKEYAQCVEYKSPAKVLWNDAGCHEQRYFICTDKVVVPVIIPKLETELVPPLVFCDGIKCADIDNRFSDTNK